jgi:hypothetical protein
MLPCARGGHQLPAPSKDGAGGPSTVDVTAQATGGDRSIVTLATVALGHGHQLRIDLRPVRVDPGAARR